MEIGNMKNWTSEQWLNWQQKVIREEMKELRESKHEAICK